MSRSKVVVATLLVSSLVMVACSRSSGSSPATTTGATTTGGSGGADTTAAAAPGVDFGDLKNVCQPGNAKSASAQGVTATEIDLSAFTDIGFTKKSEVNDTADVFTKWCNDAGGINGRKIKVNIRDAALTQDRQRMIEACASDFAVVGGGAAFDQGGVKERLKCLMPEIPAQVVSVANIGSDLQADSYESISNGTGYEPYFKWLIDEAYPDSKAAIGIIAGDPPVTATISQKYQELLPALGATVVYKDLYPGGGAADWTPYAAAIKDAKVKGLLWIGDYTSLAKLQQSLADINYFPEFIDTNNSAYGKAFPDLVKDTVSKFNDFASIPLYPLEDAAKHPASQQLIDLFTKYKPGAEITLVAVRGFSAFLLFALAARDCGDNLTRRCLYDNSVKYKEWTGGGLIPKIDTGAKGVANQACWIAVHLTPTGWQTADFKPGADGTRCDPITYTWKGDYGKATTLADVGKTLDDVK